MTAAALVVLAAALGATAWHAIIDHQLHRHFWCRIHPTSPPPADTAHDAWWHKLPGSTRIAVQCALMAVAVALALAWQPAPRAVVIFGAVADAIALGTQTWRVVTGRHHHDRLAAAHGHQ